MENSKLPTASTVAIVGAGPVGLHLALLLGKAGVNVCVFERDHDIVRRPKAAGHYQMVLDEFKLTGIYDDLVKVGLTNRILCWRKPLGEPLAKIEVPKGSIILQLEQCQLCDIMLQHLATVPNVDVCFGTQLTDLQQDQDRVVCSLRQSSAETSIQHTCQYLIGTDGGRSTVRKTLGIPLEGFGWDEVVVTTNIVYSERHMQSFDKANFIVDKDLWGVIIGLANENWRITFPAKGDPWSWTNEEMEEQIKRVLPKVIPGPVNEAKITAFAPYRMHQLCAKKFVDGRVVLAGDAAHLTNPMGGLGLTTGLLDASLLGRHLKKILLNQESPSLLQEYADKRRAVFQNLTSPVATHNLHRMRDMDETTESWRQAEFAKMNQRDVEFLSKMGRDLVSISSTLGQPL